MANRTCRAPGCSRAVRGAHIFCTQDYYKLPINLRNDLYTRDLHELSKAIEAAKTYLREQGSPNV